LGFSAETTAPFLAVFDRERRLGVSVFHFTA
jgi:hypothetical protein